MNLDPKSDVWQVSEPIRQIIRNLCRLRAAELLEGHLMPDHVHTCFIVPPKFSITFVIGFINDKSGVLLHRTVLTHKRVAVFIFGHTALAYLWGLPAVIVKLFTWNYINVHHLSPIRLHTTYCGRA